MNKAELIDALTKRLGDKKTAAAAVESVVYSDQGVRARLGRAPSIFVDRLANRSAVDLFRSPLIGGRDRA